MRFDHNGHASAGSIFLLLLLLILLLFFVKVLGRSFIENTRLYKNTGCFIIICFFLSSSLRDHYFIISVQPVAVASDFFFFIFLFLFISIIMHPRVIQPPTALRVITPAASPPSSPPPHPKYMYIVRFAIQEFTQYLNIVVAFLYYFFIIIFFVCFILAV